MKQLRITVGDVGDYYRCPIIWADVYKLYKQNKTRAKALKNLLRLVFIGVGLGLAIIVWLLAVDAWAVEPVTAYKTLDGSVYLTRDDAISHEKRGDLFEFVSKAEPGSVFGLGACTGTVVEYILDNRKELCEFLAGWEEPSAPRFDLEIEQCWDGIMWKPCLK